MEYGRGLSAGIIIGGFLVFAMHEVFTVFGWH